MDNYTVDNRVTLIVVKHSNIAAKYTISLVNNLNTQIHSCATNLF